MIGGNRLSNTCIRRPVATALVWAGICLAGLVAFPKLPVAPLPSVELPTISVSARQPGTDPETMAATIAAPLERQLGTIAGVNEMTSYSTTGNSTIVLQFDLARAAEDAARDVQAAINAALGDLPAGLPSAPSLRKLNPADTPVLVLALTSTTRPGPEVYDVADSILAQRIAQINGVAQVTLNGSDRPAIRIQVNPMALAAAGLSMEDVRQTLSTANVTQPRGRIDGPERLVAITTTDRLRTASDFQQLVLRARNGRLLRLGDIANVYAGSENERQAAWYQGNRAVLLTIFKEPGANVLETVALIKAELPQMERWLPADVSVSVAVDRTGTIRASLEELRLTLLASVVLVVVVVALFLRQRAATLAAAITVPLSIFGTFAGMWFLDYSLDNLSLMALTIATGFVVDDAIVMIENIARHREAGANPLEAALAGAHEITFTIISITLSLISVFIPILFMGGIVGRFFREFAVTLTIAIIFSAVVSLTLTPMICAHLPNGRAIRSPALPTSQRTPILDQVGRAYSWLLSGCLTRHRLMLLVTIAVTIATVWLYIRLPKGLLPEQDTGLISAFIRSSPDTSFEAMAEHVQAVAAIFANDPAVVNVSGSVGGGGANNNATLNITLVPRPERAGIRSVIQKLRPKLASIVGVSVYPVPIQDFRTGGRSTKGSYQFSLLADESALLEKWTPVLVEGLSETDGVADVSSDQETAGLSLRLTIDRQRAQRFGITPSEINAALNNAFAQRQVSIIYSERVQRRVVLEVSPQAQQSPEAISGINLRTSTGTMIPLEALVRREVVRSPLWITHQSQFPAAAVSFNLPEGATISEASATIANTIEALGLPASIHAEPAGTARLFRQSLSFQPILISAAIIATYIVLGVLYESWVMPLVILSTLPSAGLGALVILWVTKFELSIIAIIGILLLMGIVKKNAIMLVDFALVAERRDGLSPQDAILSACQARLRPILMTTLAAFAGAIPLAIASGSGAELRQPLGIAIMGGLAISQILTLFTTPATYLSLSRWSGGATARRTTTTGVAPPAAAQKS